ncbi:Protein CBG00832 [Caenorhabditis briggsae]|uniref:ETS domain-containing protein n=2 Tax=Caenorhabditis briggsae TaxID=6238 RepID=A0AAE9CYA0_CAEBR|nr:Protein CBG00832 [Caenorhabditis briggsae]ULT86457.1 hypothetical protein L3Y34_006272 [Caenorhabditis briggsae]CAP22188.2 Protein CBG00832 [Caenorhabditis briggsae]
MKVNQKKTSKLCLLPFLRGLLEDESNQHLICWTDKSRLQFRFVDHMKVTELWAATKPGRKVRAMKYDNMCKSLRTFCKQDKTLEKVEGKLFEWRFLESGSSGTWNNFQPLPFSIESILSSGSETSSPPSIAPNSPSSVSPPPSFHAFHTFMAHFPFLRVFDPSVQVDLFLKTTRIDF